MCAPAVVGQGDCRNQLIRLRIRPKQMPPRDYAKPRGAVTGRREGQGRHSGVDGAQSGPNDPVTHDYRIERVIIDPVTKHVLVAMCA